MNIVLQVFLIISLLLFLGIILRFLSKKQLNLKYSLLWLFSDFCMLVIAIFPQIIEIVSKKIGIVSPVNTIFLFNGMFIILILLSITIIVSHLNNKICSMAQSISMLEKKIRDLHS